MNNKKRGAHLAPKPRQGHHADQTKDLEGAEQNPQGTKPRKKKRWTVLVIVVVVVVGILSASYLIFRHFYKMMNYQPGTQSQTYTASDNTTEDDTAGATGTNSMSADQIQKLQNDLMANIQANAEQPVYDDNVYNILLMGTDVRESGESGRTDSMVLVSINKDTKKIVLTSFLRDIYIYIPGYDGYQRLNAANVFGGPDMTLNTIEQNFGVSVDKYAQVNFYAFIDIVDALGGVDVDLSSAEISEMNKKMQEVNWYIYKNDAHLYDGNISGGAGNYHLNGAQALAYCRVRYVDSDFGRTERQRQVLEQLWSKVKTMPVLSAYQLMEKTFPNVTTNLTEGECLGLLSSITQVLNYDVETVHVPQDGTYSNATISGMSVLSIDMEKNKTAIHDAIYGN